MRWLPALLILAYATTASAQDLKGIPRVVDGDTLVLNGERIRLHGIDAPELRQTCWDKNGEFRCGKNMRQMLFALTRQSVTCTAKDRDRYNRIVAVCFDKDGNDINAMMVRHGWALAYRRFSQDYVADEEKARASKFGMWAYRFTPPWDWRKMMREK